MNEDILTELSDTSTDTAFISEITNTNNQESQIPDQDTKDQKDISEDSKTSDQDTKLQEDTSEESKMSELNAKIESLTQELEAYKSAKKQQEKIAEQLNEFYELFPNIALKAIPDEVWESVKGGNTLAASYAVYEKRISEAARRIEEINKRNASLAAGVAGKNSSDEFFSLEEVKKMSPSEVRSNFAKIRNSMKVWN